MYFLASILFFLFIAKLWLSGFIGVHPDEAYYWAWAQNLKIGYFDHPPMIAWLIHLSGKLINFILPANALNISPLFWEKIKLRCLPLFLSSFLTPLSIAKSIEWVQRKPLRDWQIFALLSSPLFLAASLFVTPDIPFFAAWGFCLMILIRLQRSFHSKSLYGHTTPFKPQAAIFLGLMLAFAAYSKYSAILIPFLLIITGAGLYNLCMASAICLVLTLPYWHWTLNEAQILQSGVFFQLQHGLGQMAQGSEKLNFKRALDLVGSQALLWSPPIFIGCIFFVFRDIRRFFSSAEKSFLTGTLFLWAFVPVGFFFLAALKQPSEANWPLIGYLAAIVLVLSRCRNLYVWPSIIIGTHLVSMLLTYFIFFRPQQVIPWIENWKPQWAEKLRHPSRIGEFSDWKRLHALTAEATRSLNVPIEVRSYQVLAELLFHDEASREQPLRGQLRIWPEGSRKSEFSFLAWALPERPVKTRWLLSSTGILNDIPKSCRPFTSFAKSMTDDLQYIVFRCQE